MCCVTGCRYRAQKMRFAMSDARKESLRMAFGKEDGEYGDSVMGLTLGMLGAESGSGRIRAARKKKEKRQGMHACMHARVDFVPTNSHKVLHSQPRSVRSVQPCPEWHRHWPSRQSRGWNCQRKTWPQRSRQQMTHTSPRLHLSASPSRLPSDVVCVRAFLHVVLR